MMRKRSLILLSLLLTAPTLHAQDTGMPAWQVTLESGPAWYSRNDIQIPNDDGGDRFDLTRLTGSGPDPYLRLALEYRWSARHAITALYAPLRSNGSGVLEHDVRFAGEAFNGGESLEGNYKFNTYRLGYRYTFRETQRWRFRAGGTLLVRDANVRLTQSGIVADDPDLGLVPLLGFDATRYLGDRWSVELDVEGLGAPQGRAIDAALALQYRWKDTLTTRLGYRMLEGGADNDSVFTFAWVHYALLGLRYEF